MWTLISMGGDGSNYGEGHKEFMLSSAEDINSEPAQYTIAPGSIAYLANMTKLWMKDAEGEWILIEN